MSDNGNCPDKIEPKNEEPREDLEDISRQAEKAVKKYFDFRLIEEGAFNAELSYSIAMYIYVFEIKWQAINNAIMKKQIRLTPDLPSVEEVMKGFEKQVVGDTFIKAFLDYEFLGRLKDEEESDSQKKTSPEE